MIKLECTANARCSGRRREPVADLQLDWSCLKMRLRGPNSFDLCQVMSDTGHCFKCGRYSRRLPINVIAVRNDENRPSAQAVPGCREMAPLRHAAELRECLFIGVD